MTDSLQGKVLWLTRPAGTAGSLPERLAARGAEVLQVPLLEIRPLEGGEPAAVTARQLAGEAASCQHIIFISGNAVQHGLPYFDAGVWAGVECYAIGRATAELLAGRGIAASYPPGAAMNSEALLQLPGLQQVAGDKVLIVRGIGGREHLAEVLRERGARVQYLEAYRRIKSGTLAKAIEQRLARGGIDTIQAASGETVSSLVASVPEGLRDRLFAIPLVVPGERVAQIARDAGFQRVVEAANAGEDAMLAALAAALP